MKILIDVAAHAPSLAALRARSDVTIDLVDLPEERAREIDPARLREVDVLFCTLPPTNHADLKQLKWIQIASTGYSQLFGLDLAAHGVRATNARGCFDVPIAEWNIAMMINLARNLRQMIRHQERGHWDRSAEFQSEIRGKTVGIWGYGGIGRETARVARLFGMRVHVLSRSGVRPRHDMFTVPGTGDPDATLPHRVFKAGEEAEFLSDVDFLVVAMPLTKATAGLIGSRELALLPRRAFLLNPARGQIIDEAALLAALLEGGIAGAALDTHHHNPLPSDHPLWQFPNVIITPHISGSSLNPAFLERLWTIFLTNVDRYARQQPLLNELTAAELSGA
ncbi:MAG: D-2-hydroxyacid dehydrogenase [Pirellulales bacterium]